MRAHAEGQEEEGTPQPQNPGARQPSTPIDALPRLDYEIDNEMQSLVEDLLPSELEVP